MRKQKKQNLKNKRFKKKIILLFSGIILVLFGLFIFNKILVYTNRDKIYSIDYALIVEAEKKRNEAEIQAILNKMTIEEKVAQLFIITPEALSKDEEITTATKFTQENLEKYPVGGLIYFSKNIETPNQIRTMISKTQEYSIDSIGIPMFISIDEEGGTVSRLASNKNFDVKSFGNLNGIKTPQDAYTLGDTIGKYLKDYGFNLNYAPIADVFTNPENIVVKYRAFSSDPNIVADYVAEEIKGLRDNQIITTLKHFPGHGNTTNDSHDGYVFTKKTIEELRACEFIPFEKGIAEGAQIVMMAHISVPNVIGDSTPSSFSPVMIQGILRKELGFEGVIITDALNMGAISNKFSSSEASFKAINAGVDLLLMPANFEKAYDGLLEAVNNGEISQERINESVTRILKLKKEMLDW
ncbi:MAG: glycoside hydrolase family 3 protein [Firmicutes bacterium]|nr:glycoside hydrolase family 3 protein [Bacillota bacterium]